MEKKEGRKRGRVKEMNEIVVVVKECLRTP